MEPESQSFQLLQTSFYVVQIGIQYQIGVQGILLRIWNSCKAPNLPSPCPCVEPLLGNWDARSRPFKLRGINTQLGGPLKTVCKILHKKGKLITSQRRGDAVGYAGMFR